MKTITFILIILVSGALAGLVQGTTNLVMVEPYLDRAIEIENQVLFTSGQITDSKQFEIEYESYREWQKSGQVLSAVIFGVSIATLLGIIFAIFKSSIPGRNNLVKTTLLAGMMWATLYVIPFLKYPTNLPGTGDNETLGLRIGLYLSLLAISGFGALGFYLFSRYLTHYKKIIALAGYVVMISAVMLVLPESPDETKVTSDLLNSFRMASFITMSLFCASLGVIMGLFWIWRNPNVQKAKQYE